MKYGLTLAYFALLVIALVSCGNVVETVIVYEVVTNTPMPPPTAVLSPAPTPVPTAVMWVTLDGYDSASGTTIQTINIWKDYLDRSAGVVATGRHGEKVKLIRRSGDGVKIETKAGKQGWVTYYFIKEFKIPTASLTQVGPSPLPPTATPNLPVRSSDRMKMVSVPAGEFLMGSPEDQGKSDEHPQHTVYLDAFWIDQTEVANWQYSRCVNDTVCPKPAYAQDIRYTSAQQPVVGVNWAAAQAYCAWAGARLPTEAEWEKAARGSDGRTYPWGDDKPDCQIANYAGCEDRPAFVGYYPTGLSPYGVLDMGGNVWEWVADWYDEGYYSYSAERNPLGPESGQERVFRGGSWFNYSQGTRTALRSSGEPQYRSPSIGFRCAMSSTDLP